MFCTDDNSGVPYRLLGWDSKLFGFEVARIDEPNLTNEDLCASLLELKSKRVRLVYWPSSKERDVSGLRKCSGILVDRKITLIADLGLSDPGRVESGGIVEPINHTDSISELERLAIQSGEYSRFSMDPNFSRQQFVALYKTWINKSIRKENADEILLIRKGSGLEGMVTLCTKADRGDIGLLAVDRKSRGKGYGERLVRSAQRWFFEKGFTVSQVVTQERNTAACRLYKKCGFSEEKLEYFYHFWL